MNRRTMGKSVTPSSHIRSALRRLWLRSRERGAALKATGYTCSRCGAKQSRAKGQKVVVEVHHQNPIDWEKIVRLVRRYLLVRPTKLTPLCEECHKELHKQEAED